MTQAIYLTVLDSNDELYALGLETLMAAPSKRKRA